MASALPPGAEHMSITRSPSVTASASTGSSEAASRFSCHQSTVSVCQSEGYIFSPTTVAVVTLAHESRSAGHCCEGPLQDPPTFLHALQSFCYGWLQFKLKLKLFCSKQL